jgi:hypothetical protein
LVQVHVRADDLDEFDLIVRKIGIDDFQVRPSELCFDIQYALYVYYSFKRNVMNYAIMLIIFADFENYNLSKNTLLGYRKQL